MTYREWIMKEADEADRKYREAMADGRWDDVCIYGERAAHLEELWHYNEYHGGW